MASQLEKMIKVVPRWLVVILALVRKRSHIVIQKTCYFGKEEMRCFRHFLFIKTNLFRRFSVPFMSSAAQLQSGQYVCTKMKSGIKIFLYLHCKFLTRVSKCNYLWVLSKNIFNGVLLAFGFLLIRTGPMSRLHVT